MSESPGTADGCVTNALTVDVEDWHSLVHRDLTGEDIPQTEHVVTGTQILLDLLAEHQTLGTFFVTGQCAEQFPGLVRAIAEAGHEVGCHGWAHRPTWLFTPDEFRHDLQRGLATLADVLGEPVVGYRAPFFSIGPGESWALGIVAEFGLQYDSSVSPLRVDGGGRRVAPGLQRLLVGPGGLVELPMTTTAWLGKQRNISGGRWFRMLPQSVLLQGFERLNEQGLVGQVYIHSYEVLPYPLQFPRPLALARRLRSRMLEAAYACGRGRTGPRLARLLRECGRWGRLRDIVADFEAREGA